jgi:hypothetical protein
MGGSAGLTCPECGRGAPNERELTRRRRFKRVRLQGAAIIALGWLCLQASAVTKYGWAAALPDWALVRLAPTASRYHAAIDLLSVAPGTWSVSLGGGGSGTAAPTTLDIAHEALLEEVWRRFAEDELGEWACAAYLTRWAADPRVLPLTMGTLPPRWPWDVPLAPRAPAYPIGIARFTLRPLEGPSTRVELDSEVVINHKRHSFGPLKLPIDATRDVAHIMDPVSGPAVDAAVQQALRARLVLGNGHTWVVFDERRDDVVWRATPGTIDCTVVVLLDGRELGRGTLGVHSNDSYSRLQLNLNANMSWEKGGEEAAALRPEAVEFVVTGNPAASVARFLSGVHDLPPDAWAGTFRVNPIVAR